MGDSLKPILLYRNLSLKKKGFEVKTFGVETQGGFPLWGLKGAKHTERRERRHRRLFQSTAIATRCSCVHLLSAFVCIEAWRRAPSSPLSVNGHRNMRFRSLKECFLCASRPANSLQANEQERCVRTRFPQGCRSSCTLAKSFVFPEKAFLSPVTHNLLL